METHPLLVAKTEILIVNKSHVTRGSVLSLFTADNTNPAPIPTHSRSFNIPRAYHLHHHKEHIGRWAHLDSYLAEFYRYSTRYKIALKQQKYQAIVLKGNMKMTLKMVLKINSLFFGIHTSPNSQLKNELSYLAWLHYIHKPIQQPYDNKSLNRAKCALKSLYPIFRFDKPTQPKVKIISIFWTDTSPYYYRWAGRSSTSEPAYSKTTMVRNTKLPIRLASKPF